MGEIQFFVRLAEDVKHSAETYAYLYIPDKNGKTQFTELTNIEASHGIRDPRLDEGTPPEEASFVFQLYWEKLRGTGMTFVEIKAWQDLTGFKLETWEIDLLFVIHNAVERFIYERDYAK